MERRLCGGLLAMIWSWPLMVQAGINADDIDAFMAEEPAVYGEPAQPSEVVLSVLLKNLPQPGFDAAVHDLAQRWHIREDAAALIAEAQLRMELLDEAQREAPSPPAAVLDLYRRAVDIESDSGELWAAAAEMGCADDALRERYFQRPNALRKYLVEGTEQCDRWLLSLAAASRLTPLGHWRMVEMFDSGGVEIERLAVRQELIAQLRSAGASPVGPELLYLVRAQWEDLAATGLGGDILKQADALDAATLTALMDASRGGDARIEGIVVANAEGSRALVHDVQVAWLVALQLADRTEEARAWRDRFHFVRPVARADRDNGRTGAVFADDHGDDDEFVYQILAPLSDEDPFDLFIGDGDRGLWWRVGRSDPLMTRATIRFLTERHYDDIAHDMHRSLCEPPYTQTITQFPAYLEASREMLRTAIAAQRQAESCVQDSQLDATTRAISRSQSDYVEKPLAPPLRTPRAIAPLHADPDEDAQDGAEENDEPGQQESGCLPELHVIRCDQSGAVWAAVSISGTLDPTGEIGRGGYWLHLSKDQGRHWQAIYLGLQEMQPYVVVPTSKLPLLRGSTLQMEVQVRELDPASITFPPVGLRSRREVDDLYIERDLSDLLKDSDGDGLTDIVEDKLRTDPLVADTDHDGLDDDIDPLPQVSIREPAPADSQVVMALLEKIAGYDAGAIRTGLRDPKDRKDPMAGLTRWSRSAAAGVIFMQADPALFKGLLVPGKLVLVSDEDLAYLNARYGVHYPLEFPLWFNRDHTKAVCSWSAGWVGGTLLFKRDGRKWTPTVIQQWIT